METIEKKKLLKKYGLECGTTGDDHNCQIGITGMMMAPIRFAGKIFGINAFLQGIVGRPYDIFLSYGERSVFYIRAADGEWKAVGEDLWHEYMSGLTDHGIEESRIETKVECPCETLKIADVLLKSIEEDREGQQWKTAFWGIDRWCVALSATKLLCSLERGFSAEMEKYYDSADYIFYIGEMELITVDEDKVHIGSSVDAFARQFPNGIQITDQIDEACQHLFEGCRETQTVLLRRDERRVQLQLSRLEEVLCREAESYSKQAAEQQEIIDRLQLLGESLGKIEGDFCRRIRIYHLRELQQKMHHKMEEFDVVLQQELEQRIIGENDLSELADRIMTFLMQEWERYLKVDFAKWSAAEADSINQVLWEDLKEHVTGVLVQNGNPDIAPTIDNDLDRAFATVGMTAALPQIPGSITRREKGLLDSEALPVIFIAAGAVAGVAGALLPGLAFAAIGIKSKMNQQEEKEQFRKELMKEATLQERQILKCMKEGINAKLQEMEGGITQWTHAQFVKVEDSLKMQCGQQAKDRDRFLAKAAEVTVDLQNVH